MRALILVLITLNLALAAWSWHYDKLSTHEYISLGAEIPLPDEVQNLGAEAQMSSEERVIESATTQESSSSAATDSTVLARATPLPLPTKATPETLIGSPTSMSAPSPEPAAVAHSANLRPLLTTPCIVYGPFSKSSEGVHLARRLRLDGYTARLDERDKRVHRGRWVLFPVSNASEAEVLMSAFKKERLEDFALVRKSPLGMAVSAGLYAGPQSLKARLESLMTAGFTPQVDDLYRSESFYQVTVDEPPTNPASYGKFLACNA